MYYGIDGDGVIGKWRSRRERDMWVRGGGGRVSVLEADVRGGRVRGALMAARHWPETPIHGLLAEARVENERLRVERGLMFAVADREQDEREQEAVC